MLVVRPSVKVIQVSDLAAKIACELYNNHLLYTQRRSEDVEEETDQLLSDVAIVVDKVIASEKINVR